MPADVLCDRLLHPQRGAHGPLGVVLVGDRGTEQGDDRVADDLVDLAAERGDVGHEALEAVVDQVLDLLGVERLGQRGEADQVGEQDRHDPALVGARRKAMPARRAEPGPGRRVAPHAGHVISEHPTGVRPTESRGFATCSSDAHATDRTTAHSVVALTAAKELTSPMSTLSEATAPAPAVPHGRSPRRRRRQGLRQGRHRGPRPRRRDRRLRHRPVHRDHGPVGLGQVDADALLSPASTRSPPARS